MADEIVFKCEDKMWQMLDEEGVTNIPAKPFDMRRDDHDDNRIYRLKIGHRDAEGAWEPDVPAVTFHNTATGATLTRRYLGMEFTDWAPGWCFLLLGQRVAR